MKRFFRITGWIGITLIAASLIGAIVILALMSQVHPDLTLHFGHDQVLMGDLDAGHALLALGLISLALLVVFTVVPLSLAFAAVVTAGAFALVLAVVLALAAWMVSPILLLVAFPWWLLRRKRPALPGGAAQA